MVYHKHTRQTYCSLNFVKRNVSDGNINVAQYRSSGVNETPLSFVFKQTFY